MKDAIEAFADHIVSQRETRLPEAAVAAAKTFTLDTIGVGIAGSRGPYIPELLAAFTSGSPSGGGGGARVLGQAVTLAPADAALLNACQIHNSEYDCVHEEAVVHTMTVLLGVLLADADRRGGIDGAALIRAAILGVDVACNLGVACTSGLRFFRPATAGAFAGVAAIASARAYDRETLLRAFALVYAQLCGTMQAHTEGSPILAFQVGFSARNALTACDMAEAGAPGLTGVLEGPFGYFGLFESAGDIRAATATLGKIWRITEVAHKPFPSGRATHGIIDGVRELQRAHTFSAAEIERVAVRVPSLTHHLVGRPVHDEMDANYARLNAQYTAAVTLRRGTIELADFTGAAIRDPETARLARKVAISIDDNPDPNALSPIEVDLHLTSGRKISQRIEKVYGNPARPMSRENHLDKFRKNWAEAACGLATGDGETLLAKVDRLEEVADIRTLIDLATGTTGA